MMPGCVGSGSASGSSLGGVTGAPGSPVAQSKRLIAFHRPWYWLSLAVANSQKLAPGKLSWGALLRNSLICSGVAVQEPQAKAEPVGTMGWPGLRTWNSFTHLTSCWAGLVAA